MVLLPDVQPINNSDLALIYSLLPPPPSFASPTVLVVLTHIPNNQYASLGSETCCASAADEQAYCVLGPGTLSTDTRPMPGPCLSWSFTGPSLADCVTTVGNSVDTCYAPDAESQLFLLVSQDQACGAQAESPCRLSAWCTPPQGCQPAPQALHRHQRQGSHAAPCPFCGCWHWPSAEPWEEPSYSCFKAVQISAP